MVQKKATSVTAGEIRVEIPKVLVEEFQKNPRILLRNFPAGLYPIDPSILKNVDALKRILTDKEFLQNFELVAVSKTML
jgi:hypothetical protein